MIVRKVAALLGAAMATAALSAEELTSEPKFVFLRPETSFFWSTATNSTLTVPIAFPEGATTARLTVRGLGYSREYGDIAKVDPNVGPNEFTFSLPTPTSPETENVYDLTLVFDNSVTNTARLGLIRGLSPEPEGTTRCLAPQTARSWQRTKGRAVLPIPYGTTNLWIGGTSVAGDLVRTESGAIMQGWHAVDGLTSGTSTPLALAVDGVQDPFQTSLLGCPGGTLIFFK